jgi:hypothetical protein
MEEVIRRNFDSIASGGVLKKAPTGDFTGRGIIMLVEEKFGGIRHYRRTE